VLLFWLLLPACSRAPEYPTTIDAWTNDVPGYADEQRLLDETFRIDIAAIDVTLTYNPQAAAVDGRAQVRFRMRPGQTRPRIHFDPACRGDVISEWRLDGVARPTPAGAYRVVAVPGSAQPILEFADEVDPQAEHELVIAYRLALPNSRYPRFGTEVHDLKGSGNEELFPTLNTPHELARHRITLRVASAVPYRCLGSGLVERTVGSDAQEWVLDPEREVASYTLMFVLLPAADTVLREGTIAGIPVRIVAFAGGADMAAAWMELESWLPQLVADIGPFPMPRGLSVFLTSGSGGMEYFGATISSPSALSHEVFHMYFACSVVARTYRDSWFDEAITSWYDRTYPAYLVPIAAGFRSNMVGGRSPVAVGFDRRAYFEGTEIVETMAQRLAGQRGAMVSFLAYLHRHHAFAPFSTMDLAEYFRLFSGIDMRREFQEWFFSEASAADAAVPALPAAAALPDLTPPEGVLRRYGLERAGDGQRRGER
jgi:aminopeptidase N